MRFVLVQIAVVSLVVAACSYVAIYANFNSTLNVLWMAGLPIAIALAANRGIARKMAMAAVLLISSFIAFMAMVAATGA